MESEKKNCISPWTALILGLCGVIISAIIVGGILAYKALDKVENQDELIDLLCQSLEDERGSKISCDR